MSKKRLEIEEHIALVPDGTLSGILAELQQIYENNRGEYYGMELRSNPYEIEIRGTRLENDKEYNKRILRQQKEKQIKENKERAQYEKLKKKFEKK